MENREDRWRQFGAIVVRLTRGENITREEAKECWRQICEEEQSDLQQGAFIGALKAKPETPEEVAETIGRSLQFVPKARIIPCTNCGLAPMSREVAEKKLQALAEGARIASARYR